MLSRLLRPLVFMLMVLSWPAARTLATSPTMSIDRPALANIKNLVVNVDMIPFSTYPSHESDLFESKVRAEIEARLSKDGFAVLKAYDAGEATPELTFSVASSYDDDCPRIAVLHMGLTLSDTITFRNHRIRRMQDKVVLWQWWDTSGEMSIVAREDVPLTVEEWIGEAITAFEKAVKDATAFSGKARDQK